MINLEKMLQEKTTQRKEEMEAFEGVRQVKLLLEANGAKEIDVLRTFDLADTIIEVETKRGEFLQMEKFNKELGASYSIKDIKSLAIDYNLKFLPLNLYNGGVDQVLATKILEFCEKHDLDYRAEANSDGFYVLAPYSDFKLQDNFHPKPRPIVMNDPLLFYKGDRNEEVWTFVHKWGSEFTPLRLLTSMKYINEGWYFLHHVLCVFPILCIIIPLLGGAFTASFVLTAFFAVLISMIYAGVVSIARAGRDNNNFNDYLTADTFRSKQSRRHFVR